MRYLASRYLVEYNFIENHPAVFNLTLQGHLKYEELGEAHRKEREQQGDSVQLIVSKDPTKVFVVYGRNEVARRALFSFLRSISLNPQEWTEWVHETGLPSPYTGDVLKTGFQEAQAFVVLMTPDDEAHLREALRGKDEESFETELTPQPRPNVMYEAGMAMGVDERRTILVQVGRLRPMSDILGRHVIRLDDSPQKRKALAQRLQLAGCPAKLIGEDWITEGNFAKALEGL
jgi:predicted nucleotide-binding protein